MNEFTLNDPHPTETKCKCGSVVMETINKDCPHGMSALNDGFDYECHWCRELVRKNRRSY